MVKSHRTGKDRMMEEIFRWMSIGFIAGLWLSLEECESGTDLNSNTGVPNILLFCCKTHSACCMPCLFNESHPVQSEEENEPESEEEKQVTLKNKWIGQHKVRKKTRETISPHCRIKDTAGLAECDDECLKRNCSQICCIVCHKDSPATNRPATTATITPSKMTTTATTPRTTPRKTATTTVKTTAAKSGIPSRATNQPRIAEESNSPFTTTILLVLLLFVAIVIIIAAVVLFMRKRKFSRRGEVSMTRTDENEAVSSGYETTVRESHYELSGEGAPIYTELELTQETAPSNSTVYASVQPTGEAIDMGKRVDYAELDKVAVAVSPIYSQPFGSETSAINADYAEPFKPDDKSTATAPVHKL